MTSKLLLAIAAAASLLSLPSHAGETAESKALSCASGETVEAACESRGAVRAMLVCRQGERRFVAYQRLARPQPVRVEAAQSLRNPATDEDVLLAEGLAVALNEGRTQANLLTSADGTETLTEMACE